MNRVRLAFLDTSTVAIARHRHGDLAVIRGLSRRERDELDALHVF